MLNFKEYLSNLYEMNGELGGIDLSFKDSYLEKTYAEYFEEKEWDRSKIFSAFSIFWYCNWIYTHLSSNNYKLNMKTILTIITLLLEIFMGILSKFIIKKKLLFFSIKYLRFLMLYIALIVVILFPNPNLSLDLLLRNIYKSLVNINLMYLFYLDFSYIIISVLPLCNIGVLIYVQRTQNYEQFYLLSEMIGVIIFSLFTYVVKKSELIANKKFYFEYFKNEKFIDYIRQLIDVLTTNIISLKKDNKIIFLNKFAINYFNKNFSNSFNNSKESEKLLQDNFTIDPVLKLKNNIHLFFKSIIKNIVTDYKEAQEEKNLNETLVDIFKEEKYTQNFIKIGFFNVEDFENSKCYEIYVRKLKFNKEDVVELLMYDVSDIKLAERVKTELLYKQKILSKMAHEFKTPLITIITLVNSILQNKNTINKLCEEIISKKLFHINSLSNQSILLVQDIIHYVSGNSRLKIKKEVIDLKEVILLSNNILITLIECDEIKLKKITPFLKIDEKIDDLVVMSDENLLKQILVNFITNAVKFTKDGNIKLKAEYKYDRSIVEISVKDTGIGIREEEKKSLFKEKIQMDLNHDYNSKGSGLGLSICKSLANLLGYKIGFKSNYEKGSKFFLEIKCDLGRQRNNTNCLENEIIMLSPRKNNTHREYFQIGNYLDKDYIISVKTQNSIEEQTEKIEFGLNRNEFVKNVEKMDLKGSRSPNFELLDISSFGFDIGESNDYNEAKLIFVVVDDHKIVRDNTKNLLKIVLSSMKIEDYLIIEGSDGIDLINIVKNDKGNKIKCILLDENMEYLNGSETVKILRKLEEKNVINKYNYVSVTAFDDQETKNNIIKSGINSILSKPCTKSSLINVVKKLNI